MKTGDIGTKLIFTVKDRQVKDGEIIISIVDLTSATKVEIVYKGYKVVSKKECTILEPRTNGKVMYIIESGDFPREYNYITQIIVTFDDGNMFYSDSFSIVVGGVIG